MPQTRFFWQAQARDDPGLVRMPLAIARWSFLSDKFSPVVTAFATICNIPTNTFEAIPSDSSPNSANQSSLSPSSPPHVRACNIVTHTFAKMQSGLYHLFSSTPSPSFPTRRSCSSHSSNRRPTAPASAMPLRHSWGLATRRRSSICAPRLTQFQTQMSCSS
jgi:hypothetical protein